MDYWIAHINWLVCCVLNYVSLFSFGVNHLSGST